MSDWYWRVIALKAAFALTFIVCSIRADDTVQKLPFCNPNNVKEGPVLNDLVIVSTLDGRLTAFSTQNGIKAWDLETQPLLSSNLHHVELTSGGKWVRLVPSLSGSLYSLSGDTIEPLPFDAEQLLSSSFKYSDDLVIAGARETLWFGLDAHTGGVIYECGTGGCSSEQQTAGAGRDVLVLRRHASTVRALDPRTGSEKWNFSVAEHRIALSRRECADSPPVATPVAVAVALPEGVVAIKNGDGGRVIWQQKLDAPVAGMWRLHSGTLQNIDVLWEATQTLVEGGITQQPSLYIGVHDRQLYIQESEFYSRKLETAVSAKPLPWKLVTARTQAQLQDSHVQDTAVSVHDGDTNALSLVTLYGNTAQPGDHGYFVYLQETCDQSVQVSEDNFDDSALPNISDEQPEHHHIHVHISSLWYWWKEVLLIAISSALLMNLMIWPRFFAPKIRASTPLPTSQEQVVVQVCGWHLDQPSQNIPQYSGRYDTDFQALRLLGKGGFGVVFEAMNKIDHCSYAVKRITLPRRESKRERVLREVRALAKLEHEHIVRYFNAWVEEPPPSWQRQKDAQWMRELESTSLALSEEYTATSPAPYKRPHKDVLLDLNKCSEPSKRIRSQSCNDSFSIVFDENAPEHITSDHLSKTPTIAQLSNSIAKPPLSDDDSFIVFANTENNDENTGNEIENTGKEVVNIVNGDGRSSSFDKRLERVKECDYKTDSVSGKKKKIILNSEYVGHNDSSSPHLAIEDSPPIEENRSSEDNRSTENYQQESSEKELLNAKFHIPGYCRAPHTNQCIVYGCTNSSHRVPKSLRIQLLFYNNYYVPLKAHICEEHLQPNIWDVLLNAPNRQHKFNPVQVADMMELLKEPIKESLSEKIDQVLFGTGRVNNETETIITEEVSFSVASHSRNVIKAVNNMNVSLANMNSGQKIDRPSTYIHISRKNLERLMKIANEYLKGHTRHWSLDMVVRSNDPPVPTTIDQSPQMYLYIQMQLCRRDSLHDWLRHNVSCDNRADKAKILFSQIVSAVEYVHLAGLIHRDLKPSNIFFAADGRVKVGDFGLVTAMNDTSQDGEATDVVDVHHRHTYRVGTHLYMSPEQLLGRPYSYKVDIYSLGLILFELLQPFGTESERVACLLRLRNGHYPQDFHKHYPKETDVLKLMLSEEPSNRPTATGIRARAPLYQPSDDKYHFTLPSMSVA